MSSDINDVFDCIVCGDMLVSKNGFDEGFIKGRESGVLEGYHLGYHKAIELGVEIGFYSGFLGELESVEILSVKARTALLKFKTCLKNVTHEQHANINFELILRDIRSHYKSVCSLLGDCSTLPSTSSSFGY